jgi:hypothetical protein
MASNVDIVEVLSELCSRREEWAWLTADYARRLSSGNTALFLEFPFAARPSHRIESAQLNAITILATLFVTPSVRAQFVSHAPFAMPIRGPRIWTLRGNKRIAKRIF